MNITLYEQINIEKLNEVLLCDNLPFTDNDDPVWIAKFTAQLKKYANLPNNTVGKKIIYKQVNNYGRLYANTGVGLQMFQKDVRKYISNEYVDDIDIVNCHPVILAQLLNLYGLTAGKTLPLYNLDRQAFIKKYNLNSKLDFIYMLNSDTLKNEAFREIHDIIYNILIPKLKLENKALFNRIKKNKKSNYDGSFLSNYLQNIENNILICMKDYVSERGLDISTLCFDGFTVCKNDKLNEQFLLDVEEKVFQVTKYRIKLAYKSMDTEWTPLKKVMTLADTIYPAEFSRRTTENLAKGIQIITSDGKLINEDKLSEFVSYLNNFVCLFENPSCYGFRHNTNDDWILCQSPKVVDLVGKEISFWKASDNKLKYKARLFVVDNTAEILKSSIFNLYVRPPSKVPIDNDLKTICPKVYDYLFRIICSNNDDLYNCLIHYMAKITQVGMSGMCLVLMGERGVGKSSFSELLSLIVGKTDNQYSTKIDDILSLNDKFNYDMMTTIITCVEEIPTSAATYHAVQSKLKSLITEANMTFQMKGIDKFKGVSCNNYILNTNELNPVFIHSDNRRFIVVDVSNAEKAKSATYFKPLRLEIKSKIEEIRYFFNNFQYIEDINSIRPTTDAELRLLLLNESITDRYIREALNLKGPSDSEFRRFSSVYDSYINYCREEGKKPLPKNYFSLHLDSKGYQTIPQGKSKSRYIQGDHARIDVEIFSDEDEIDEDL